MEKRSKVRKNLSKSLFMKGLQCHKALWLTKHHPELRPQLEFKKEVLFEEGHQVGAAAQKQFPEGRAIDKEADTMPHRLWLTKQCLSQDSGVFFEATVQAGLVLVMADIVRCFPDGLEMIEVKSGRSEKKVFLWDMALQLWVFEKAGFTVKKISLMVLNPHYVRQGDLSYDDLFQTHDLTDKVRELLPEVDRHLKLMQASVVQSDSPQIEMGAHCHSPYECEFKSFCSAQSVIPDPTPIEVGERKILKDELKSFLQALEYPLSFLDFEGFQMAIPPFDGIHPYQQVPFQFSLHIQSKQNGSIIHINHVVPPGEDPRQSLEQALKDVLPKKGSVLVYNSGYEKQVLQEFGMEDVFPRLVDLMVPFVRGWVVLPETRGKTSIKVVLPALNPNLNYDHLAIQDGETATRTYYRWFYTDDPFLSQQYRENLIHYCTQDTLALIGVLEVLRTFL